jgi:hypothetical protein
VGVEDVDEVETLSEPVTVVVVVRIATPTVVVPDCPS